MWYCSNTVICPVEVGKYIVTNPSDKAGYNVKDIDYIALQ